MKTKMMMTVLLTMMVGVEASNSFAQVERDGKLYSKGGGGGDASEVRVNEIRNDILSWIEKGGSEGLKFPSDLTVAEYNSRMTEILQPKAAMVTFVENDDAEDEELRVLVDGKPKTCRGYYTKAEDKPAILCHIGRFSATSESDQYRLIHHEYAGLVNLEKNDGAVSDYVLSGQITNFLQATFVLRLAVLPKVEKYELFPGKIIQKRTRAEIRSVCFQGTLDQCKKFGFILRSPDGKESFLGSKLTPKLLEFYKTKFSSVRDLWYEANPLATGESFIGSISDDVKRYKETVFTIDDDETVLADVAGDIGRGLWLGTIAYPMAFAMDVFGLGFGVVMTPVAVGDDLFTQAKARKRDGQLQNLKNIDFEVEVSVSKFNKIVKKLKKAMPLRYQ